jgi:hypothetical protein
MAIVKPEEMDFSTQRFSCIIYGSPGVGKTTLALSAPDPLLLDFDRGVSRVKAEHRKPTSVCATYEEVLADINSPEMKDFQTIVIDTGGSFITFLKDWAMRTKQGARQKNGEFNSMKGYGFVKNEFQRFTEDIKTRLNKNVIYVFHSVEGADKDGNPIQRLMCEGSTKNTVWTPCDFGGYVQMVGDERFICFTPEQEYFAKGCHGIDGKRRIPVLKSGEPNLFMSRLFDEARANIAREAEASAAVNAAYHGVMDEVQTILDHVSDIDGLNYALSELPNLPHVKTSRKEAAARLAEKAKQLGAYFDKDSAAYIAREAEAT